MNNNFIEQYFLYFQKFILQNYPKTKCEILEVNQKDSNLFKKDESPLHNSVISLNLKLLKKLSQQKSFIEIGCGKNSTIANNFTNYNNFQFLDLFESKPKNEPRIPNIIGNVVDLPFPSNKYDYILSNQSIEHWYEYGVPIKKGLLEIKRILKNKTGRAYINFPLFLHGQNEFVVGNLISIFKFFISVDLVPLKISFVKFDQYPYYGWERCKQSKKQILSYISKHISDTMPSSFVVEIEVMKLNVSSQKKVKLTPYILRRLRIFKNYGVKEIARKIFKKFFNICL